MGNYLGRVAVQERPHQAVKGVTVGAYGADHNGGDEGVFFKAMQDLPDSGGKIEVLPGSTIRFKEDLDIQKPNVRIVGDPSSELHNAPSGTEGLFNVTGDHFRIAGLRYMHKPVPGQRLIRILANDSEVDGGVLDVQSDGLLANPSPFVQIGPDSGSDVYLRHMVRNVTAHPRIGVSLVKSRATRGLILDTPRIGKRSHTGDPVSLYRMLDMFDDQETQVLNPQIKDVGDVGTPVNALIFLDGSPGNNEHGHLYIDGGSYEGIRCDTGFRFRAGHFVKMRGGVFGKWDSVTSHAVRVVDADEDEDVTDGGGTQYTGSSYIEIDDWQFHNCRSALLLGHAQYVSVRDCQFTIAPTAQIFLGAFAHAGEAALKHFEIARCLFETTAGIPRFIQLVANNNLLNGLIRENRFFGNAVGIWNGPPPSNVNSTGLYERNSQGGSGYLADVTW